VSVAIEVKGTLVGAQVLSGTYRRYWRCKC